MFDVDEDIAVNTSEFNNAANDGARVLNKRRRLAMSIPPLQPEEKPNGEWASREDNDSLGCETPIVNHPSIDLLGVTRIIFARKG